MFYYTICAIRDRLMYNKEVDNPTDSSQSLLLVQEDRDKLENLYNRLNTYISKLDILFNSDCTESQAKDAWYDFFNHDYWNPNLNESARSLAITYKYSKNLYEYDDTEEIIENIYPTQITTCFVNINVPNTYQVFWKVKNDGALAEQYNCIRGQIFKSKENVKNHETSNFSGNHYVECYIIKNNLC